MTMPDQTTTIIVTSNADGITNIKVETELDPQQLDLLGQQIARQLREPAVARVTRALAHEGVELEAHVCPDGQYLAVTNPHSHYEINGSGERTSTAIGPNREDAIANLANDLDGKTLTLVSHQGQPSRRLRIQS